MSIVCLGLVLTGTTALAKKAVIDDVIITNAHNTLLLYCSVQGCFTEEMNRAILNGVPTTFTFHVELYKKERFSRDEKIFAIKFHRTIKYNTLKNEFTLVLENETNSTVTVKEFFKAKKRLTELSGLKLISLDKLDSDQPYYVRIKAELNKVRLPFYLHYILFFVSLWDFETDWHEVHFTY